MVLFLMDGAARFKKMIEEGKLYLLTTHTGLRFYSNYDSEVDNVESDYSLVSFQDFKTGPYNISRWPTCRFDNCFLIGSHWHWSNISWHF